MRRAAEARINPEVFGDPDAIAEAMVATLPLGHRFDELAGPFYDTAGLTRWLGVSRQAVHQRAARHAIVACPLADEATVYPVWQVLDNGATIPGLAAALAALAEGSDDPWMWALWLRAPTEELAGRSPSDWLRDGDDPAAAITLARQVAAGWRA